MSFVLPEEAFKTQGELQCLENCTAVDTHNYRISILHLYIMNFF